MIGVCQHDVGAGGAYVVVMHALDRALRADRHESRRAHHAMRRRDFAGARGVVGRNQAEREARHRRSHGVALMASLSWRRSHGVALIAAYLPEQHASVAIGVEALVAGDGVTVSAAPDAD